ncbi:hypothetical protein Lnau_1979 [Legionella nautarum]|uniref:Cytochrome c domain-containing protein n=1 Tax=Legionella nautarum TaxID=45070 RepID=A0A0W0WRY6_9GAMM|nr:c-type cytochrome [Legionella nautarum]KTD35089.1 hypothetical protein Lnau_1979 [Legionella nautarum]
MKPATLFLSLMLAWSSICVAQNSLTINIDGQETSYTPEALLANPHLVTIKGAHLPTYPNQSFDLKAIPLCSLLNIANKKVGAILKVQAFDKYVSYFNLHRIYPCDKTRAATAYLAIEEPNKPWPIFAKLHRSVGPFYLIWQGEKVPQTDWVFGPEYISTTDQNPFSSLLPANSSGQEAQGLEQFANKCGVCHSINLVGNLELGPDLNFPSNVLEYLSEAQVKKFIRNPQSVRFMKNDKMFAFSKKLLSEEELNAIIAFLKLMKSHKIKAAPPNIRAVEESVE